MEKRWPEIRKETLEIVFTTVIECLVEGTIFSRAVIRSVYILFVNLLSWGNDFLFKSRRIKDLCPNLVPGIYSSAEHGDPHGIACGPVEPPLGSTSNRIEEFYFYHDRVERSSRKFVTDHVLCRQIVSKFP